MKTSIVSSLLLFLVISVSNLQGQEHPDNLFFKDRLQPVSEDNIFKTEGYYNWGVSNIKGDNGKYIAFIRNEKRSTHLWGGFSIRR
jgi:hypothetical protein